MGDNNAGTDGTFTGVGLRISHLGERELGYVPSVPEFPMQLGLSLGGNGETTGTIVLYRDSNLP
jgi:hypothetical protein